MAWRGNREGTLYRRADGRWGAALTLPTGRRRSFYARTRLMGILRPSYALSSNGSNRMEDCALRMI